MDYLSALGLKATVIGGSNEPPAYKLPLSAAWPLLELCALAERDGYDLKYSGVDGGLVLPRKATDRWGRSVKTSKVVAKYRKVLGDMGEDVLRHIEKSSSTNLVLEYVVSWAEADIRTAAHGHGRWHSCLSPDGCNNDTVESLYGVEGSGVAFVRDQSGRMLARFWLRHDGLGRFWPEDRTYGFGHDDNDFRAVVVAWLKQNGLLGCRGRFHSNAYGWSDMMGGRLEEMERPEESTLPLIETWEEQYIPTPRMWFDYHGRRNYYDFTFTKVVPYLPPELEKVPAKWREGWE